MEKTGAHGEDNTKQGDEQSGQKGEALRTEKSMSARSDDDLGPANN